jgi:hypothetical protein
MEYEELVDFLEHHVFREDYFAVPDILARKQEFAEFFASVGGRLDGPVQLVYARTSEGRRMLLSSARAYTRWRVPKTLGTCELLEVTNRYAPPVCFFSPAWHLTARIVRRQGSNLV